MKGEVIGMYWEERYRLAESRRSNSAGNTIILFHEFGKHKKAPLLQNGSKIRYFGKIDQVEVATQLLDVRSSLTPDDFLNHVQ